MPRVLSILAAAVIVKVTIGIILIYGDYFPPNFNSDFLRGRDDHFFGAYQGAFYTHILSGPVSLILGLILVAQPLRDRFPRWHRRLGWLQVGCVVLLVAPSGLVMARHAAAGPIAGIGLATLAILTATSHALGSWKARAGRFADHRRWMWRGYILLGSAVVLRLIGGLATVTGLTFAWVDPLANWASWLVPLTGFEIWERIRALPPGRTPRGL